MTAHSQISIDEVDLRLAWSVRGDAAEPRFAPAVLRTLGLSPPTQPNTSARDDDAALLRTGPTTWLFVGTADTPRPAFDDVRRALNEIGAALFDLSSSYVAWRVAGTAAARVLNRGCPLDLSHGAFPPGHCAQSMLGHLSVLLHRPDDASAFIVMVARSYARDARAFLHVASLTETQDA